jgi:methylmalonyl-CoA mutase N-terminal domain/subunit
VLGGTQSLHTNSMDEALALPTRESRRRRPAHAADHRPRERCGQHHRSAGWLLLRRGHTEGNDDKIDLLRITNEDEARQRKRLDEVRHTRNRAAVDDALARLKTQAADPEVNLMPVLIEASRAYVTLGEMMGALADVFGRHTETPTI